MVEPRPVSRLSPQRPSISDSPLDDFLRRVRLTAGAVVCGQLVGRTMQILVLVGLAAIYSDAFFAWPAPVRASILSATIGLAITGLLIPLFRMVRSRYDARHLALRTEQALGRTDSLLINAVEFRSGSESGSPSLRKSVIQEADQLVAELPATLIAPIRPGLHGLGRAVLAALVLVACAWMAPRLFGRVVPRYLDPKGDHPPYTLLEFAVTTTPEVVHRGHPVRIHATITGPEAVANPELVIRPIKEAFDPNSPVERIPMSPVGDSKFTVELPRVDQDLAYHIETTRGRSDWYRLNVSHIPLLEDIQVTITPPDYSGQPAVTSPLDQRGLRGLAGSRVTLHAHSNRPLKQGDLSVILAPPGGDETSHPVTDRIALSPVPNSPEQVQGEFVLARTGRFELNLQTPDGHTSETLSGPVIVTNDQPPRVSITSPGVRISAIQGWKIPVEIAAADDIGISGLTFSRSLNEQEAVTVPLETELAGEGVRVAHTLIDLAELNAQPGDTLVYYATVTEQAEQSPRSIESTHHTIRVITEEEYRQRARKNFQIEDLIREFKSVRNRVESLGSQREQILEQDQQIRSGEGSEPKPGEPVRSSQLKELEQDLSRFAESSKELVDRLNERANQLPLYDVEQDYHQALKELAEKLQAQQNAASEAANQARSAQEQPETEPLPESLKSAMEKVRSTEAPFDQESQSRQESLLSALETLQAADQLQQQVEKLSSVANSQADLTERLDQLKSQTGTGPETPDSGSPPATPAIDLAARQQQLDLLAREQDELSDQVESIRKELSASADKVQDPLPLQAQSARQLSSMIRQLAITREQQAAATFLRSNELEGAAERAEAATRKLASLKPATDEIAASDELGQGQDPSSGLSPDRMQSTLQQSRQTRQSQSDPDARPDSQSTENNGQDATANQTTDSGQQGRASQGGADNQSLEDDQLAGPRDQSALADPDQESPVKPDLLELEEPPAPQAKGTSAESLGDGPGQNETYSTNSLRGVPVRYRNAAEAYLKRLSEKPASGSK